MGAQMYGRGAPIGGCPHLGVAVGPDPAGELLVAVAAPPVVEIGAGGRPPRDQEQVGRQRPRVAGREHPILQRVALRVLPVVRDLPRRVEAHDVGLAGRPVPRLPARVVVTVLGLGAAVADLAQRTYEPVHLAAVDRDPRALFAVRSALIERFSVVVGPAARTLRIGHTRLEATVREPRDAVGTGERAEVVIERAVLLHDEHEVVDVLDAGRRVDASRRRRGGGGLDRRRHGGGDDPQDDERQQDAEGAGHGIAHATRSPGPLREPLAP